MGRLLTIEDDALLLAGMIADNQAAFTEIYYRYWSGLYTHALKITQDRKDAEDIVQEVFCSFWKRRRELVITESVSSYLFTSVRYSSIRYIETNLTRHKYYQKLSEIMDSYSAPPAEVLLEYKEMKERLSSMVEQLPSRMQEVYVLSRMQHLSHKEIASKLNIAESTVKKQIGYALKIIKQGIPQGLIGLACFLYH